MTDDLTPATSDPSGPQGSEAKDRPARLSADAIADALERYHHTPEQVAVIEAPLEPLLVVAQRDPELMEAAPEGLFEVGTEMSVLRTRRMRDGTVHVDGQG